ncbi:MAG: hypothetical protein Q9167_000808 [Letrouitia subvulpina]
MSDAIFSSSFEKGKKRSEEIQDAKPHKAKYEWDDLGKSGWVVNDSPDYNPPTEMKKAMRALMGSSENGENVNKYALQSKPFLKMGKKMDQTGAMYWNAYNVSGRAIIADNNYSPTYMVNYDPKTKTMRENPWTGKELEMRIPEMHHYSDVVWAIWDHIAGVNAGSLRFIFRGPIVGPETRLVIERAAGVSAPGVLKLPWPGKIFDMSTYEGKAPLGTDHGSSVAWLLTTGKYKLGERKPVVHLFTDDDKRYFMVWVLEDV